MKIGLLEFNESMWPSLERTKAFYLDTITKRFDTCTVTISNNGEISDTPDAIVNFMGNAGWELNTHPDCPLIFGIHGGTILNQRFLRTHLEKLRPSDMLIVNCQSDIDILNNMFAGNAPALCHLPLPVDGTCFRPMPKNQVRKQLGLQEDDIVVGFVSRLLPQKNLHRYLDFLAQLKKQLLPRKVKGIVIGKYWVDYPVLNYQTSNYPMYIQQLIEKQGLQNDLLYFPANLTNDDLATCYNAMDLFIHPTNSIDENFGYAPVEAMACGTPLLGAAYGGLKDTIISGTTGFLMPTWVTDAGIRMDTFAAMQFAKTLLTNTELKKNMSAAALKHAANYNKETCADILCTAITQAVEKYNANEAPVNTSLSPIPAISSQEEYLPKIDVPWKYYKEQVRYYVSNADNKPDEETLVYTSVPVVQLSPGSIQLDDPAWPAVYPTDSLTQTIISYCQTPIKIKTLLNSCDTNLSRITSLINAGLLSYSHEKL
ncbi:glycosyltransferase family 4 protein [Chitinophaga sancti]|uniref:glycosyltransferase family 4 protein n=1 Tax=Chitinophaga sancti TaxID=1004 RepID=UPI003F794199